MGEMAARKKNAALSDPSPASARGVVPKAAVLGPGLHGAVIELKTDRSFQIRTASGERVAAVLGDGVAPALADECLRTARLVIVMDSPRGPTIMGALQTSVPLARDEDGIVSVEARELRMHIERSVLIEVGQSSISADSSGAVRIEGDRMVIDMGALLRVLSAKVELP